MMRLDGRGRRLPSTSEPLPQPFDPPGATLRNSIPPSPYRPGFERVHTFATVSRPARSILPCPTIVPRSIRDHMGIEWNRQARR